MWKTQYRFTHCKLAHNRPCWYGHLSQNLHLINQNVFGISQASFCQTCQRLKKGILRMIFSIVIGYGTELTQYFITSIFLVSILLVILTYWLQPPMFVWHAVPTTSMVITSRMSASHSVQLLETELWHCWCSVVEQFATRHCRMLHSHGSVENSKPSIFFCFLLSCSLQFLRRPH